MNLKKCQTFTIGIRAKIICILTYFPLLVFLNGFIIWHLIPDKILYLLVQSMLVKCFDHVLCFGTKLRQAINSIAEELAKFQKNMGEWQSFFFCNGIIFKYIWICNQLNYNYRVRRSEIMKRCSKMYMKSSVGRKALIHQEFLKTRLLINSILFTKEIMMLGYINLK